MPYWKPLTIDGVSIDLSHLEIFEFEMLPTGSPNKATIRVIFNNRNCPGSSSVTFFRTGEIFLDLGIEF